MYEIGDEVIYQGADKRAYKRRGVVTSIAEVDGKPQLMVELDGGETFTAPIDDWSRAFANSCTSTNSVVVNAMAAHRRTARNSVEVEVSLMYAGRVQHAMRDAARSVSGVRMTGTNTLFCPDEDAADEVVDILEQAGIPKREISLNAKRVARNAMQDAGSYVRECNKFIPEANAMIREWDAFYKKMTAKRKWYDSKMTELQDGFYRIDKGDPDYDKARAAYDALRDVSRSAYAVHLFYGV